MMLVVSRIILSSEPEVTRRFIQALNFWEKLDTSKSQVIKKIVKDLLEIQGIKSTYGGS